jgi:hypothetical protein
MTALTWYVLDRLRGRERREQSLAQMQACKKVPKTRARRTILRPAPVTTTILQTV